MYRYSSPDPPVKMLLRIHGILHAIGLIARAHDESMASTISRGRS